MLLGAILTTFDIFLSTSTARYPTGSAMVVCLDNQIFYGAMLVDNAMPILKRTTALPVLPVPDDREEQSGMCPAVPPQVVESQAPTSTPSLPNDESNGELEPADAEPRLQPPEPMQRRLRS